MGMHHFDENSTSTSVCLDRVRRAVTLWGINFECLIECYQGRWTDEEKNGVDSLRLCGWP
jgi:hypothetical protein